MAAIWAVRHRIYGITSVESYQHDRTKELRPRPRTRLKAYVYPSKFACWRATSGSDRLSWKSGKIEESTAADKAQQGKYFLEHDCGPILLPASSEKKRHQKKELKCAIFVRLLFG